jgi:hypothetical protein
MSDQEQQTKPDGGASVSTDGLERICVTDEELTRIYNEANKIPPDRTGRTPITTERIFTAMRAAMAEERKECARFAVTEAALQHDADTARNPRAAVMHSPDAAKWLKMAAMIRLRSNVAGKAHP